MPLTFRTPVKNISNQKSGLRIDRKKDELKEKKMKQMFFFFNFSQERKENFQRTQMFVGLFDFFFSQKYPNIILSYILH